MTDAAPDLLAAAGVAAPVQLFADIVFDRPFDHAYTYAVPESLRDAVGVGKRVEAPFGRGDKATVGYCIRVADLAPERACKPLARVLDDDALLDDHLLKLTRWMADYYLCGWGQVLHAVVPAGVRENAGTRNTTFVEAVPAGELPDPLPTVTAKQKQILTYLRDVGAVELRRLLKATTSGTSPVSGLVEKGLARKRKQRVESAECRVQSVPIRILHSVLCTLHSH